MRRSTLLAFAIATSVSLANSLAAEATNYYVSKNGNNKTGLSWQSAWNELNQINWSIIQPGDRINLDGGSAGMTYKSGLVIPASSGSSGFSSATVVCSNEAGRNGTVIVDGSTASEPYGIDFQGTAVVSANRWAGISIQNFSKGGVHVDYTNALLPVLEGVVVNTNGPANKTIGLDLYAPIIVSYCWLLNNVNNVIVENALTNTSLPQQSTIQYCWIANSGTQKSSTGVQVNTTPVQGKYPYGINLTFDVFGPGLSTGLTCGNNTWNNLSYSIFENASNANIVLAPKSTLYAYLCTSFMTHLNANGKAHSCLTMQSQSTASGITTPTLKMGGFIFYGGAVSAPAGATITQWPGGNFGTNFQYNTTSNTTLISYFEKNPQFVMDVSKIPNNASFNTLENMDFTLQAASVAKGSGSCPAETWLGKGISSVSNLFTYPPIQY